MVSSSPTSRGGQHQSRDIKGGKRSSPSSTSSASSNLGSSYSPALASNSQRKRPLACISCRHSKLKCQFSSTEEPRTCDRCRLHGFACKVEGRSEERQHFEDFTNRLTRVEDLLEILIGRIDTSISKFYNGDDTVANRGSSVIEFPTPIAVSSESVALPHPQGRPRSQSQAHAQKQKQVESQQRSQSISLPSTTPTLAAAAQIASFSPDPTSQKKRNSSSGSLLSNIPESPASSLSNSTVVSNVSSPVTLKNNNASSSNGTSNGNNNSNVVIWRKRDRKQGGTAKELLSEINNNPVSRPNSPANMEYDDGVQHNSNHDGSGGNSRAKRAKLSPDFLSSGRDLIDRGLVNATEADECLMFFSTNISRYLPVLVLNYVVYFDSSIRQRSPLLFASVLAVSSLYHPKYHNRHRVFRKELETLAAKIDRPRVQSWDSLSSYSSTNNSQLDIQPVLDDILALIISGAWLGGELGFRASLVASEMFGYLLPENPQKFAYDEPIQSMLGAIGLVTYIIEKRLRIMHDRPSQLPLDKLSNRRDLYLPIFLSGLSGGNRCMKTRIDPAELKATANVELCALMMMYQQELSDRLESNVMSHWNTQLDKWLGEWTGKLTVHLKPSTWKPLMLTFHYAKLFLNLRVIQETTTGNNSFASSNSSFASSNNNDGSAADGNVNDNGNDNGNGNNDNSDGNNNITGVGVGLGVGVVDGSGTKIGELVPPSERMGTPSTAELVESGFIRFVALAEKAALDVLEMLVYDEDIQRMIKVGPVFYPTIFVTAGAFLLKLLCVGPKIQYETNEEALVSIVADATSKLEECVSSDILPCYVTVRNLEDALRKVIKILQSTGRYKGEHEVPLKAFSSSSFSFSSASASVPSYLRNGNIVGVGGGEGSQIKQESPVISLDPLAQQIGGMNNDNNQVIIDSSQPISYSNSYQWSFSPANSQPSADLMSSAPPSLPVQQSQSQGPRLVPEGMIPLLHPMPVAQPPSQPPPQWPAMNAPEGLRQFYGNDPNFLMDAHSTNLLSSLFDTQFMNGS